MYLISSESNEVVHQKAMELLPDVYAVKFHFFENQLPKLANGKYDGITLIKSLSDSNEITDSSGTSATAINKNTENVTSPYTNLANEISDDL